MLAPHGLYHPILPQRIKEVPPKEPQKEKVASYGKVIFTLCKTCAEVTYRNECEHTDDERSFIGTWTADEVNKAIEKRYKVLTTYEVWHFDKTTDGLFKGYIRRFMKIKLESSKYDFKTKEEETNFSAGLRSVSKICLNSLWGKFGQKSNMSQTRYVTEVSEFYEILLDDKLDNLILTSNS